MSDSSTSSIQILLSRGTSAGTRIFTFVCSFVSAVANELSSWTRAPSSRGLCHHLVFCSLPLLGSLLQQLSVLLISVDNAPTPSIEASVASTGSYWHCSACLCLCLGCFCCPGLCFSCQSQKSLSCPFLSLSFCSTLSPESESARISLAQLSELGLIRFAAVSPARQCAALATEVAELLPALAQSSPSWPTFFLCADPALPASNLALLLLQVLAQALFRYHCECLSLFPISDVTVLVRLRDTAECAYARCQM